MIGRLFVWRRYRSRVPRRLHENPHRFQRFIRRSAVLVRILVRPGLRVHQRHRTRLLRVLHTAEQVRHAGQELQTRRRQEEPSGEFFAFGQLINNTVAFAHTCILDRAKSSRLYYVRLVKETRVLRKSYGRRWGEGVCFWSSKTIFAIFAVPLPRPTCSALYYIIYYYKPAAPTLCTATSQRHHSPYESKTRDRWTSVRLLCVNSYYRTHVQRRDENWSEKLVPPRKMFENRCFKLVIEKCQ